MINEFIKYTKRKKNNLDNFNHAQRVMKVLKLKRCIHLENLNSLPINLSTLKCIIMEEELSIMVIIDNL
jgi:hypothetical protein